MKTMTCNQLGGPSTCSEEFKAETFEEMAELSKKHGEEMFQKNDRDHIKAMEKMKDLMNDASAMKDWMEERNKKFENLPIK